ncbi:MAG TPA: zinc ribbon domain-containing protein [Fimbriimonas sp.]|nr:zinc ribbon domain-containing protein [Fimbriimonas sp.]
MDIPPLENKCRNCGRPIPDGALFCGMCGTRPQQPSGSANWVSILLFCLCGLPCGGFGACTALMISGQPYANQDFTFVALGILGIVIFIATLVYMVKSIAKK